MGFMKQLARPLVRVALFVLTFGVIGFRSGMITARRR